MHMADGFISPAVGCTMWAASAAITALCARKVRQEKEVRLVPLMGVLGAFIFACQMLNFTIPGTGSSGHLGGGLILAVLLRFSLRTEGCWPWAATSSTWASSPAW